MPVGRALLMVAAVWTTAALGSPRMLVVGAGDCRDVDLVTDLRAVAEVLRGQVGDRVLDEPSLRALVGAAPSSSPADIALQLQNAKGQFYDGRYASALKQLDGALEETRRLPPGPERWSLTAELLVYRANTQRHEGRLKDATESFQELLRLNPGYQLDPAQFAPSTREFFRAVRHQLQASPHHRLTVASEPSGATVYLDGAPVGRTPYVGSLPVGAYELRVGREGLLSFAHHLELQGPREVTVDLGVEGAVARQWPPCVRTERDGGAAVRTALSLASTLGAEDAILVRVDHVEVGPAWLTASLLNVSSAQSMREGRIKLASRASPPTGVEDLVRFVLTGQPSRSVQRVAELPRPAWAPAGAQPGEGAPEGLVRSRGPGLAHARLELGLAAGAVAAAGVGLGFQMASASRWNDFNAAFQGAGPGPSQAAQVSQLAADARTDQTVAVAAFVGAGALAVADLVLFLVDRHEAGPLRVDVAVGPGRAGAQLAWALP